MEPKEIAEKLWGKLCINASALGREIMMESDFEEAIKEAIELFKEDYEESKWKYPERGEMPEERREVLIKVIDFESTFTCKSVGSIWYVYGPYAGCSFHTSRIKCWQYAPEVK